MVEGDKRRITTVDLKEYHEYAKENIPNLSEYVRFAIEENYLEFLKKKQQKYGQKLAQITKQIEAYEQLPFKLVEESSKEEKSFLKDAVTIISHKPQNFDYLLKHYNTRFKHNLIRAQFRKLLEVVGNESNRG